MRYLYSILTALAVLSASCKKNVETIYEEEGDPFVAEIKVDKIVNDSTLVLKWNKYPGTGFHSYKLWRTADISQLPQELATFNNPDSTSYTDLAVPSNPIVEYKLEVATDSSYYYSAVDYKSQDFFYGNLVDVLINKDAHLLYLFSGIDKKIAVYNYTNNQKLFEKTYDVAFGYCALGNFAGINDELYVPRSDGWLDILNASNLDLKSRIYVSGTNIGSVIAHQGKLYVSSTDLSVPYGLNDNAIKVYDRATSNLIARTGIHSNTKLLFLESTNLELAELTLNLIPVDLCYYSFDANGQPLVSKADSYHGDYLLDPGVFRSFPDGEHFITSTEGNIFDKTLVYQKSLGPNYSNSFADFAFSDDGTVIYAADALSKRVEAISYPQLQQVQTYTTGFYPVKLFKAGEEIICVSVVTQYSVFAYFTIEKIKL